ncbi:MULTISPECIES: hypothetical protein [Corynebacterium]|uniref:Uncharacterized protein n=1 Tax=Corynebacterium ihumii TaxID=1232427 RepID=A0ABY7UAC6_9CORY|nr:MULTISPECIES: hypothetical protein [Corynebacterium]WCZ33635.1 hypothetical protein CIHUM_00935 [Corynebacterium ihumii]
MSVQMTERPERCTPISKANFVAEVRDLAAFYKDRIPLHWEDALHDLIYTIGMEPDDAAD